MKGTYWGRWLRRLSVVMGLEVLGLRTLAVVLRRIKPAEKVRV